MGRPDIITRSFNVTFAGARFPCERRVTGLGRKTQWVSVRGIGGKCDHRVYGDGLMDLPLADMEAMARAVAVEIIVDHQKRGKPVQRG